MNNWRREKSNKDDDRTEIKKRNVKGLREISWEIANTLNSFGKTEARLLYRIVAAV